METLVFEDSPLGSYLEGSGEIDSQEQSVSDQRASEVKTSSVGYAPPTNVAKSRKRTRHLIQPILKSSTVGEVRQIYAALINFTLGRSDNARFLEHFRYQIIASQLLNDSTGSVISPSQPTGHCPIRSPLPELAATTTGACAAAAIAFTFVWIIHWARSEGGIRGWGWRAVFAMAFTLALCACIWIYMTRRTILCLRRNAIDSTSTFTTNLQSLNSSSNYILSLIQEVELVSRGYRISHPLPPISRIENTDQPRKAVRLRAVLQEGYQRLLPVIAHAVEELRPLVDQHDVERFLDVYDVRSEDIQDALLVSNAVPTGDVESLRHLRVQQVRYGTLRRLLLCSLLSLQATGRRADASKWQLTITVMESVSTLAGELAQKFIKLLSDEDQPPTPVTSQRRTIGGKEQYSHQSSVVESQVRRISTLSNGIRSLQAKLYLLREESARALSGSTSEHELSGLTNSLREQYESLGADLQCLMQAWEAGKQALAKNISKQERRMSQPNSPDPAKCSYRPVSSSDGHLAPVSEDGLPQLRGSGNMPLSPPVTDDGSEDHSADDEIFEAISSPRLRERSTLGREERIAKVREERERLASAKERREANTNMVRELQSVIKLRPIMRSRKQDEHNRVSSM